ncbi:MAG: hypothetical protein JXA42_05875, partial [Anaerolineales bacterium]|nr:hypothetical protein [Anaerolineales bacterium]
MIQPSSGKLLIDESPLIVLPTLATLIGLNEAIVLQQIHYWTNIYRKDEEKLVVEKRKHFHDGRWWVYNSKNGWQQNFPFWHISTVGRVLDALRKPFTATNANDSRVGRGPLLLTGNYNKMAYDRTLWYAIDYAELENLESSDPSYQIESMDQANSRPSPSQNNRMDAPKTPSSSPQNGIMQPPKMALPIPETTQRQPEKNTERTTGSISSSNGSSITKHIPIPIENLKDEIANLVDPSTFNATIEPLKFYSDAANEKLVITADD